MDAMESPTTEDSPLITPPEESAVTPQQPAAWQERLQNASDLPVEVRKQIESLLPTSTAQETSPAEPQLSLGRVLDLLEGVIPLSMRLSEGEVAVAEHPSGEGFFGIEKELTDADAERLAWEQLERCGLLRK